ncbi:MAG: threonylcarbamoyl-AMP synthase [Ruminococcus sp.]|nr:threonylcarbamoyl-AMP synthase [Ruminococcus sp.]
MAFDTELLDCSEESIERAAELIKSGEVVGMPTETVYGLAANAFDVEAVAKIFKAKGRPADNPLIVHISDLSQLEPIVSEIPQLALSCAKAFWSGPLTMIFPKNPDIPYITSGGLDTVGVRMPSHPAARALIEKAGVPLAAPSANLSGSPSPTTAAHVMADMKGRIPAVIDGGECEAGVESTVIAFGQDSIRILRPGRITREMLLKVCPNVEIDSGVLHEVDNSQPVASPGMKYKHYSPAADVIIVSGSAEKYLSYVKDNLTDGTLCLVFDESDLGELDVPHILLGSSGEQQAHNLFAALREADRLGAKTVFARCPERTGVGLAVYNRLIRAAGFKVVEL